MDNRYELLFQPIHIGPVVAPNRFYQVPHCNGLGYRMPRALAAMRGIKAEGGWGVVCTEEVEIHHSSDLMPYVEGRLWGDRDVPPLQLIVEAVHEHGALAGIELTHSGHHASNLYSRVPPLGPRSMSVSGFHPWQTRRMDKEDIRNLRRWHREAALRAKRAGFDIIYCYAGHNLTLAMHFLLRRYNDRSDEYGGSLENRVRLLRELIEDTKEAVGDTSAVAVRLAVDELIGEDGITHQGEGHDIVAMLAELPDLWDVNVSDWSNDSGTSRFEKEGYQEPYIAFVKTLTSKPVVGVGRYTSPDSMVSVIKRGVVDFIGAARPSIADPFLPQKIKEERTEDIRECIGCNICVIGDLLSVPIRCTQNPTMGEEWRRGWHPEIIPPKKDLKEVLVVGAGPAGLECARALGQRGYSVILVEARNELGGRVSLEANLPGLSEWRRVIDWRLTQIGKMDNVAVYPASRMSTEDVLEAGPKHVVIATGSQWRRDGVGRTHWRPIPGHDLPSVFTPDDILAERLPTGQVVVYDDDHYYMGGLIAEWLSSRGCAVTLVTPAPLVSHWTQYTLEQERIQRRLMTKGVALFTQYSLASIQSDRLTLSHTISSYETVLPCDAVVLVTTRAPNDELYLALKPALEKRAISSLRVIGDAEAPNIIAQAVFSGYLAAADFNEIPTEETPFRIEYVEI
jgi:dimethylamine/trimethylamine dehydrogenase